MAGPDAATSSITSLDSSPPPSAPTTATFPRLSFLGLFPQALREVTYSRQDGAWRAHQPASASTATASPIKVVPAATSKAMSSVGWAAGTWENAPASSPAAKPASLQDQTCHNSAAGPVAGIAGMPLSTSTSTPGLGYFGSCRSLSTAASMPKKMAYADWAMSSRQTPQSDGSTACSRQATSAGLEGLFSFPGCSPDPRTFAAPGTSPGPASSSPSSGRPPSPRPCASVLLTPKPGRTEGSSVALSPVQKQTLGMKFEQWYPQMTGAQTTGSPEQGLTPSSSSCASELHTPEPLGTEGSSQSLSPAKTQTVGVPFAQWCCETTGTQDTASQEQGFSYSSDCCTSVQCTPEPHGTEGSSRSLSTVQEPTPTVKFGQWYPQITGNPDADSSVPGRRLPSPGCSASFTSGSQGTEGSSQWLSPEQKQTPLKFGQWYLQMTGIGSPEQAEGELGPDLTHTPAPAPTSASPERGTPDQAASSTPPEESSFWGTPDSEVVTP